MVVKSVKIEVVAGEPALVTRFTEGKVIGMRVQWASLALLPLMLTEALIAAGLAPAPIPAPLRSVA